MMSETKKLDETESRNGLAVPLSGLAVTKLAEHVNSLCIYIAAESTNA